METDSLAHSAAHQEAQLRNDQFPSKGKWFNSEAQRVLDDRASRLSDKQSTLCLRWNVASLIALTWFLQTNVYRQIKSAGLVIAIPLSAWSLLEWLALVVLAFNASEAAWYLVRPQNQYAILAMTPSQRLCIGLDVQVEPTTSDAPTRPPKMTPPKSSIKEQRAFPSVTDLESRRSAFSKGNNTPCPLHSPVSLTATADRLGYSTDGDLRTVAQVLKRVPGSTTLADNTVALLARSGPSCSFTLESLPVPSAFGNSYMATPYPPVSRHGIGNNGSNRARIAGDQNHVAPFEVLEKYGVEHDVMDRVEGMGMWFVCYLLHPLYKQIDELDFLFGQHGLSHLSCRQAVLDTAALERAKSAVSGGFGIAGAFSLVQNASVIPQTLVDFSLKHGKLSETKECMALEEHLGIPGYLCSFYDVNTGQTNLFIMLMLVLEIQHECTGYLGLTNLGGKHVGLLAAIGK
ncbi:hypothetical protein IWW37_000653 [Coemansia sp. RSA 2050]|nr:hypothetical protein IWW37_000653 [Coemansia sp. RSA 2050]